MADDLDITCPCCSTRLTVDAASGEILAEQRPAPDHGKTFDAAMTEVQDGSHRRAALFDKAFDKTLRQDELLDKKFEQAKKKAAQDRSKPRNPFDME